MKKYLPLSLSRKLKGVSHATPPTTKMKRQRQLKKRRRMERQQRIVRQNEGALPVWDQCVDKPKFHPTANLLRTPLENLINPSAILKANKRREGQTSRSGLCPNLKSFILLASKRLIAKKRCTTVVIQIGSNRGRVEVTQPRSDPIAEGREAENINITGNHHSSNDKEFHYKLKHAA